MLVNHSDSGAQRIVGGADRCRASVDYDLAVIGAEQAVEDVHQRGFAGAVFAEQAVDARGGEGEGDVVEGLCLAESLGDVKKLDGWRHLWQLYGDAIVK